MLNQCFVRVCHMPQSRKCGMAWMIEAGNTCIRLDEPQQREHFRPSKRFSFSLLGQVRCKTKQTAPSSTAVVPQDLLRVGYQECRDMTRPGTWENMKVSAKFKPMHGAHSSGKTFQGHRNAGQGVCALCSQSFAVLLYPRKCM